MGQGPIALLKHGLAEHLRTVGCTVDVASVCLPQGLHAEASALIQLQRLTVPLIRNALERHSRPVLLSGNCGPAALSAMSALAGIRSGIVWFDAHADFNTPETSPSGYLDGMGLAILIGRCWRRLAEQLESFRPVPDTHVIQVGVRENDPPEIELLNQSNIRRIACSEISNLSTALQQLRRETVYVHVDVDVLDVSEGRANDWACSGGLSVNQLCDALGLIGRSVPISVGAVTCYDPAVDADGRIGAAIPRIVELLAR
jgi:arginase